MKGIWLIGLVSILIAGCAPKADEETAKAPDASAPEGKPAAGVPSAGGSAISKPGDPATFVAVTEIFNKKCTGCHGNGKSMAGYDLTSYDSVMKGGKTGPAIVAGDENSLIVQYLTGEKKPQMPKGGAPLDPTDIELVKAWIKAGAKNG